MCVCVCVSVCVCVCVCGYVCGYVCMCVCVCSVTKTIFLFLTCGATFSQAKFLFKELAIGNRELKQ